MPLKFNPLRSCNVMAHFLASLALEKCEIIVLVGSYSLEIMYLFKLFE